MTTNNSIPRLLWMDSLKLFAIYLVVLGHVVLFGETDFYSNPVWLYIYSFHMPLFMTISGFFSYKILKGEGDITKKFKQLIIPCITLGIIFYVLNINGQNVWYLKSLFICYGFACLFHRFFINRFGRFLLVNNSFSGGVFNNLVINLYRLISCVNKNPLHQTL